MRRITKHSSRDPELFPEVSTPRAAHTGSLDFIRFNAIILKTCQPDLAKRFASAAEMRVALLELERALRSAPAA